VDVRVCVCVCVCVYMAALPSSRCARDLLFSNVGDVNLDTQKRVCLCLCEKSICVCVKRVCLCLCVCGCA